jgi:hypothetical protein
MVLTHTAYAIGQHTPASSADEQMLRTQHPELKDDCGAHTNIDGIPVKDSEATTHGALVSSCSEKCKAEGCPYEIYVFDDKSGKYDKAADFFGRYDVQSTLHHGFHDVQVIGSHALQFDGTKYIKAKE